MRTEGPQKGKTALDFSKEWYWKPGTKTFEERKEIDWHWSWEILLFPIGVAYIFLNSIWVGLTLAHFATRYRDLLQLVSNIMQPMFFITPILWGHDKLAAKAVVFSEWNPFYNFIELVRAPLLMTAPEPFSYMYVSVITLVGLTFAVWLIRHSGRSVVFWL